MEAQQKTGVRTKEVYTLGNDALMVEHITLELQNKK
jgi:hypothetical protein